VAVRNIWWASALFYSAGTASFDSGLRGCSAWSRGTFVELMMPMTEVLPLASSAKPTSSSAGVRP